MDNIYRIVVGYDYSELADQAVARAFELASREEQGEVHVVHVSLVEPALINSDATGVAIDPGLLEIEQDQLLKARVGELMSAWQGAEQKTFSRLSIHSVDGSPARELAQLSSDLRADLLIVGTHGRTGLKRLVLGSVAEGVLRLVHCPVLVLKDPRKMVEVAEIEAACPRCLEERQATGGQELWCERHREKRGARHTYHYQSRVGQPTNHPLVINSR